MKPDTLITGGFGFIGYHLAKYLMETTDKTVVVAGRRDPDGDSLALMAQYPDRLLFESIDLHDMDEMSFPSVKEVYHLAARKVTSAQTVSSSLVMDENLDTDSAVFFAFSLRPDVRLVYASTGEVFGPLWEIYKDTGVAWPIAESEATVAVNVNEPNWLYALSKIAGEMRLIHGGHLFDWRIARLQNPYGPRMGDATLLPVAMRNAVKLLTTSVFIDDTRPFLYVEDAVAALVTIMDDNWLRGRTVGVCGPEERVEDVVNAIYGMMGYEPITKRMQRPPNAPNRVRALKTTVLNASGWAPHVTMSGGLRRTWDYYRTKSKHS